MNIFSAPAGFFLLPHTSGLLLHKAEIVGAWRVYSYFNWPFTFSCSDLNSLINPLQYGFCFCHASWPLSSLLMKSLLPNPTVKYHSCLLISVAFPGGERSLLSSSSMAPHVCGFPLTFLASFATNSPLNVAVPPRRCLNLFSWLHTLPTSFYNHLCANDSWMYVSSSCLFPKLKYNMLNCLLHIPPWIYHHTSKSTYLKLNSWSNSQPLFFPKSSVSMKNSISCYKPSSFLNHHIPVNVKSYWFYFLDISRTYPNLLQLESKPTFLFSWPL